MFLASEAAKAAGGVFKGKDAEILSVSTDTRTIEKGALFIAIRGENFDGNDFIEKAFENGAAAVLCSKKDAGFADKAVIFAEDTRQAQLKLARYYRDKFAVKVCAVTGSVGKTSTKDMIFAALSGKFNTLKTEGNFNNDIGLPRTLFRLDKNYEAAVIEMGMSGAGEISVLSQCASPDCCVITNIGFCHIEYLKTQENILKAKLEILDGAKKHAPLIVCGDDRLLKSIKIEGRKIIKYGFGEDCDVRAEDVVHLENGEKFSIIFNGEKFPAEIPAVGEHMILNALAAFAAGTEFGMKPREIIPSLMSYTPSGMRQKIEKHGGVTFILDCYNASPTSMETSLGVLGALGGISGKRIAVLGDMLELGEMSEELHAGLCGAVMKNADAAFLLGKEMKALYEKLNENGFPAVWETDKEKLCEGLAERVKNGDAVLFKGSRGMKMEEAAEKLRGKL